MTSRQVPVLSTNPGGVNGQQWTDEAAASVRELFKLNGGALTLDGSSTANAIIGGVEVPTGFDGYTNGLSFQFLAGATNTGAVSIALGGLQAIPVRTRANTILAAGDIASGDLVNCIIYNQICYVDLAPKSNSQTDALTNRVKRIWTVDKQEPATNASGTIITFDNIQGDIGDIIELPEFYQVIGPITGPSFQFSYFYHSVTGDMKLSLFKDETEIRIIWQVISGGGGGVANTLAQNLIEIDDTEPHDYSLRREISDPADSLAFEGKGLVRLLSIDGSFT